jgi:hypothetical protein
MPETEYWLDIQKGGFGGRGGGREGGGGGVQKGGDPCGASKSPGGLVGYFALSRFRMLFTGIILFFEKAMAKNNPLSEDMHS